MLKSLSILLFLVCIDNNSTYIKNECYEGYIFKDSYFKLLSFPDIKGRFTPSAFDIGNAERIIRDSLHVLVKLRYLQHLFGFGCKTLVPLRMSAQLLPTFSACLSFL